MKASLGQENWRTSNKNSSLVNKLHLLQLVLNQVKGAGKERLIRKLTRATKKTQPWQHLLLHFRLHISSGYVSDKF